MIKELRTKYNLTQAQLSKISGIPQRSIENWESGLRHPPEYLIKLLDYYLKHHKRKAGK